RWRSTPASYASSWRSPSGPLSIPLNKVTWKPGLLCWPMAVNSVFSCAPPRMRRVMTWRTLSSLGGSDTACCSAGVVDGNVIPSEVEDGETGERSHRREQIQNLGPRVEADEPLRQLEPQRPQRSSELEALGKAGEHAPPRC